MLINLVLPNIGAMEIYYHTDRNKIYCRLTLEDGSKARFSTGWQAVDWEQKKQFCSGWSAAATQTNQRLGILALTINSLEEDGVPGRELVELAKQATTLITKNPKLDHHEVLAQLNVDTKDFSLTVADAVEQYVDGLMAGKITRKGTRFSDKTIGVFEAYRSRFRSFLEEAKFDIAANKLAGCSYKETIVISRRWENFFSKYFAYLQECSILDSSKAAYCQRLATILRHYNREHYFQLDQVIQRCSYQSQEFDPLIIEPAQVLDLIYKDEEYRQLIPEKLHYMYTIIQVGLLTMLRKSDLFKLTKNDIIWKDGEPVIRIYTNKKQELSLCPFLDQRIYQNFCRNIEQYKKLAPKRTAENLQFNRVTSYQDLRAVFSYLPGFDIPHTEYRMKEGKQVEYNRGKTKMSELIGFHTLRRSGATLYAALGYPDNEIMKMGGWRQGSIAFAKRYRQINASTLLERTRKTRRAMMSVA